MGVSHKAPCNQQFLGSTWSRYLTVPPTKPKCFNQGTITTNKYECTKTVLPGTCVL